eukprot:303686-Pyramimonas_sp.AAC.1
MTVPAERRTGAGSSTARLDEHALETPKRRTGAGSPEPISSRHARRKEDRSSVLSCGAVQRQATPEPPPHQQQSPPRLDQPAERRTGAGSSAAR